MTNGKRLFNSVNIKRWPSLSAIPEDTPETADLPEKWWNLNLGGGDKEYAEVVTFLLWQIESGV